jgi:hypothetical protein
MKILNRSEMEKLTTPRLLAYHNSLLKCREGDESREGDPYCCPGKGSEMWKRCYDVCKDILSKREHVNKKPKNKRRL